MSAKTITKDGVQVEVGQVWQDLDKRGFYRTITVTRVDELNGLAHYDKPVKNRLRINRMHLPFWKLVQPC